MTSTAQLSRVLLVAEPARLGGQTPESSGGPRIRRYKLARLELDAREARFAHLRTPHD